MAPAFVDLPAEIRLLIYGYLLTGSKPTCIVFSSNRHTSVDEYWQRPERLHTAILRVNKKIYHESSYFLYTQNRFCPLFHPVQPDNISRVFGRMGQNAALIRHLGIAFPRELDSEPQRKQFSDSMDAVRRYCPNLAAVELFTYGLFPSQLVYTSKPQTLDFLDGVLKKMGNLREIKVTDGNAREVKRVEDWRREMAAWSKRGWKVQFGRRTNWLYIRVRDPYEEPGRDWREFISDIRDIILDRIFYCLCYCCQCCFDFFN